MSAVVTDVRCPTGASSLMGRLVSTDGEMDPEGLEGLLLQLHCRECTKDFRRIQPLVLRVLHLYTLTGVFDHTQVVFRDGAEAVINLDTQVDIFKLSTSFKRGK